MQPITCLSFFFFNDTATTEIYTLSLHDALPICDEDYGDPIDHFESFQPMTWHRSEEHTSELQSHLNLVCRLLLEKKKKKREKTKSKNIKCTNDDRERSKNDVAHTLASRDVRIAT